MTVTTRPLSRPTTPYPWVPAATGWIVGVIATLSLIASVSPLIRSLIRIPAEFVNNYLFNFPDTSFAWATVLALLAGALAARKRVAWWALILNLVLAIGFNVGYLVEGDETRLQTFGEIFGLSFHIAATVILLMLALLGSAAGAFTAGRTTALGSH